MTTIVDVHSQELAERGYTQIDGISSEQEAADALRHFGTLMPQYDGSLRYQVRAAPGFERRRYSKSTNTIPVHTEAPGWDPPPRYLALHCRVMARCGNGHTELADAAAFVAGLDAAMRQAVYSEPVEWIARNSAGGLGAGVRRPIVEHTQDGRELHRFSYNLLTAGLYDPDVDAEADPENLPLGARGVDLAEQAVAHFRANRVSILIPQDSILLWDNHRILHARSAYKDVRRHLTRYWLDGAR
jgi:alpha-ketoglutarate-dependent taurine dioxygenase